MLEKSSLLLLFMLLCNYYIIIKSRFSKDKNPKINSKRIWKKITKREKKKKKKRKKHFYRKYGYLENPINILFDLYND